MFDGARPGLALLPRRHFGVQFLFRCHNSMLHRYVRHCAPSAYFHLFKREAGWKKAVDYLNPNYLSYAEKRRKHTTLRRNEHFPGFHECFERDRAASWRYAHEVNAIGRGVSHGKSVLLCQPPSRLSVWPGGEHAWFSIPVRWIKNRMRQYESPFRTMSLFMNGSRVIRRSACGGLQLPPHLLSPQLKGQCTICERTGNLGGMWVQLRAAHTLSSSGRAVFTLATNAGPVLMESVEVGLGGGKSWSHFLSAKMGVDITRMRSAQGNERVIVSNHSNLREANFGNVSLKESLGNFAFWPFTQLNVRACILFWNDGEISLALSSYYPQLQLLSCVSNKEVASLLHFYISWALQFVYFYI